MNVGPGVSFEPVTCFAVDSVEEWWHELEPEVDITTAEGWLSRYRVGAVLDRRRRDGSGQFHLVTPLGPIDLNRPEMRWELSGEAPLWTASPSIKVGPATYGQAPDDLTLTWHGYLTDGQLTGGWE